ncbi:MAG: putative Type IV pilus pilin [Parcubacteria bacterium C7867-008]|nr:MAG: putative Type IV pilus pilin [Parcubacteria bacterium C7867-008]
MESIRTRSLVAHRPQKRRGFTLVELLVSLSIVFLISAIAITGQSTFNQGILLNDTAYSLALSTRQAQSLGLSSRKFAGVQNGGYGIYVTNNAPINSYIIFADINSVPSGPSWCTAVASSTPESKSGNCMYDGLGETFQTYTLTRGFTISDFCGKTPTGLKCASTDDVASVHALFLRPNTSSVITGVSPGGTKIAFSCLQFSLRAPGGTAVQTVRVTQVGEISVGQICS